MTLNQTYFEKFMRTQILLPKMSAMGQRQKNTVNSNELNRRISNINEERLVIEEPYRVVNPYTSQLKNSG